VRLTEGRKGKQGGKRVKERDERTMDGREKD